LKFQPAEEKIREKKRLGQPGGKKKGGSLSPGQKKKTRVKMFTKLPLIDCFAIFPPKKTKEKPPRFSRDEGLL